MNTGSHISRFGRAVGLATLTASALTYTTAVQAGPTFKCKSNQPPAEKAICANENLWRYDHRMASLYFGLKELLTNESKRDLLSDQRTWLKERSACKWDVGCLSRSYQTRISFLEGILAQGENPAEPERYEEDTKTQDWQDTNDETANSYGETLNTSGPVETIEVSYPAAGMSLGANLRIEPGKGNTRIGVLVKGDPLIILDKTSVLSGQYSWYHVMGPTGAKGYIWGGALCNFYDSDDGVGCSQN